MQQKEILDFTGTVTFKEVVFDGEKLENFPHMAGYPVTSINISAFQKAGYILTLNGIEFNSLSQFMTIYHESKRIDDAKNAASKLPKLQSYTTFDEAFPNAKQKRA